MKLSSPSLLLVLFTCVSILNREVALGQAGTPDNQIAEFKQGWSSHVGIGFGGEHAWHTSSQINPYYNSLQFTERYTVRGNFLRIGLGGGLLYDGRLNAYAGPQASFRIFSLGIKSFGNSGIGNVQLQVDNYYGTNSLKLLGGGVVLELGNLLTLSLKNYYEFNSKQPWSLVGIGFNIRGKQKITDSDHFTK